MARLDGQGSLAIQSANQVDPRLKVSWESLPAPPALPRYRCATVSVPSQILPRRRLRLLVTLLFGALLAAACSAGPSNAPPSAPPSSPSPSPGGWASQVGSTAVVPILASSELAQGKERFLFSLTDKAGQVVADP
jgi:hypothetical protein